MLQGSGDKQPKAEEKFKTKVNYQNKKRVRISKVTKSLEIYFY